MRSKKDFFTGIILIVLGLLLGWESSSFPTLGGMSYGPGLFPTIAATGLVICGFLIFATAFVQSGQPQPVSGELEAETAQKNRVPHPVLNTVALLATVIFYALSLDYLGFHLVSFPVLLFLFVLLRVKWWLSLLLAAGMTIVVHIIFYTFLHVPLPWGLLEPFAW